MAKGSDTPNGLLIVDKPGLPSATQPTSHDVVAAVRRWSGQRRIGHTGTLDPMASGVLVLCLGRATRLVEYYQGHDKQYVAEVVLGSATDTYDALGTVTDSGPVRPLDTSAIEKALEQFRGEITQIPPAYSAIKQGGEALHRRARRGEAVQAPPRRVFIRSLDLLELRTGPSIRLRVVCSAGAYIRSLAHDIGAALGTFAHLGYLRREAAGPFSLPDAHSLDDIRNAADNGDLGTLLLPMGTGLELPALHVNQETVARLGFGQQVSLSATSWQDGNIEASAVDQENEHVLARAIAPDGSLAGIVRCLGPDQTAGESLIWRATKWLHAT